MLNSKFIRRDREHKEHSFVGVSMNAFEQLLPVI